MKKCLFVTTVPSHLGYFLLPHAKALKDKGWRVDAMSSGLSEDFEIFDRIWDVPFERSRKIVFKYHIIKKQLLDIIGKEKYDLLHLHTPISSFIVRLAVRKLKYINDFKIIYTAHGFHFHPLRNPFSNLFYFTLEKIVARWTDIIITINEEDYEYALKKRLKDYHKIKRIPGIGIDLQRFKIDSFVMPNHEEKHLSKSPKIAISVAEFIPRKRHKDLIKAAKELSGSDIDLLFLLVGDGRLKVRLEKLASRKRLENVIFLGKRTDVPELLVNCDYFIHPAIQEGLPMAVMEAMAMEKPVIGANVRGTRELLEGGCGILVEPKRPDKIAEAIRWLMNNPEEAEQMGKRARRKIEEKYALEKVLPIYVDIVEELFADKKFKEKTL
ncbi:MAG: glycosyltransferase family 4 protein [Candidatus Hadarchaeales archaeon]